MGNPQVSIITVDYKSRKELLACIHSIRTKLSYEVIVVDNNDGPSSPVKATHVHYVKSSKNEGYGVGMNLAASHAKGQYLFILNPDTVLTVNVLDTLVSYLENHPKVGIAAPNLMDPTGKLYPYVGTGKLTPIAAIFSLSIIHRLFPNNPIAKQYWLPNKATGVASREVIPGTAFMISKKIFDAIGGFDPHFFLYFEEFDLCKRVRDLGYEIALLQSVHITHAWGISTKSRTDTDAIFQASRMYYFRKHYGMVGEIIVEAFTRLSLTRFIIFVLTLLIISGLLVSLQR